MCGIAGIASWNGDSISRERLVAMRDALAHRGPDDAGLWMNGSVGLAHRRLSIIDIANGHQPMSSPDGRVRLVFNGEIYNHAAIRHELTTRGHEYRTRSDTETILQTYLADGVAGLERLEGMFAFALWDERDRSLHLMRDRLGIKPLYYLWHGSRLLFASEIKAFWAYGAKPTFSAEVLPQFLANRYVAGEDTFFEGVRKVVPAHRLTWTDGRLAERRRYWTLPGSPASISRSVEELAVELKERLTAAVERHLMSDVPLGMFLSGGLDSSALAALAARTIRPARLQTFSVGFDDRASNELPYARLVADALRAEHREVVVSESMFLDALPRLVWQQDEPMAFTSCVALYFVSELARQHVKVVLTGEGSDELFLGYDRYKVTHWNLQLGRPYAALPKGVRRGVRGVIQRLPARARRYGERSFLALDPGVTAHVFDNWAVFPGSLRRELLEPTGLEDGNAYEHGEACFREAAGSDLARMGATDIHTYLIELLMKQDRMSMAASIESRVPFLDDQLVSWVASLPASVKLHRLTTKKILRDAVADMLPGTILTRRKMGFPVPFGRWLRESRRDVVDEFVTGERALARGWFPAASLRRLAAEHRSGTANHGERLWLLINFEVWQRLFCDGESPDHLMQPERRRAGVSYANGLGEDGGVLAAHERRTPAFVPDSVGAIGTSPGDRGHHDRPR